MILIQINMFVIHVSAILNEFLYILNPWKCGHVDENINTSLMENNNG